MRIWNEIELYKSGGKSRAFLANNFYLLKEGLAGSQKSNSGDCYRRDANLFGIISRQNPRISQLNGKSFSKYVLGTFRPRDMIVSTKEVYSYKTPASFGSIPSSCSEHE